MTDGATTLTTSRLRLVSATVALITAELEAPDRLAAALDADLPRDWPPEHHDVDTLKFWRGELSQPGTEGWWLHYVLVADASRPVLVGTVGYKGPPTDGVVEIGYSIIPSWRRQGLATEACQALIESAWIRGAQVMVAQTLLGLEPSIAVLLKLGFVPSDSPEPGVLAFALRRHHVCSGA